MPLIIPTPVTPLFTASKHALILGIMPSVMVSFLIIFKISVEEISSIKILIDRCHELHRRNEILINRKLEAVKGALASLREGSATDDVEVYTKAGGLAKPKYNTPIKKT